MRNWLCPPRKAKLTYNPEALDGLATVLRLRRQMHSIAGYSPYDGIHHSFYVGVSGSRGYCLPLLYCDRVVCRLLHYRTVCWLIANWLGLWPRPSNKNGNLTRITVIHDNISWLPLNLI